MAVVAVKSLMEKVSHWRQQHCYQVCEVVVA